MTRREINTVVEEAAKLLRENPDWTYIRAINKAREMIQDAEKISKI